MKKILIFIMAAITKLNKSMVWIIGTIVLLMSLLLTVDVILRYFFNSPTSWAFSLATWGTGLLGFALGGYTLAIEQHVRVDLYFEKFSPRMKSIVDMISAFFLFLMAAALFWFGLGYVIHYYQIGATMTGGLAMPLWIAWLIVPLGGLLIGLQGLVKFFNDLSIIITGKKIYEYEIEEGA
ncbi:TRAP transporter small permease subunit [Sporosarcina soli]|uniref:TRAP transporter small permease subunit n=1 Tax=Sporosarcina soli TaxID=334736 RepID=A0ABW0TEW5_9BACL